MVDFKIVDKYLGTDRLLFKNIATSFIESYSDFEIEANEFINKKNSSELHRIIHSQKGISLNLGLQKLYDFSLPILEDLRNGIINTKQISEYAKILNKSLKSLKKYI